MTLTVLNGFPKQKVSFYQKGLGSKHPHAQIERQHPAPFSFQDISRLVIFFTKKGMKVLDPFGGVGSTAKACELEGRVCTSIELQKKWHDLAIERLETEVGEGISKKHTFILGDTREELKKFEACSFDFIVTSPPYWSILNKKADYKVKRSVWPIIWLLIIQIMTKTTLQISKPMKSFFAFSLMMYSLNAVDFYDPKSICVWWFQISEINLNL